MSKHLARLALAAALALVAAAARAGTATATMNVSANVISNCTISASAPLAFGDYDPIVNNAATDGSQDLAVSADLSVICSKKAPITVTLKKNALAGATASLAYDLFSDGGHTVAWDETLTGTVSTQGNGKTPVTLTVYGVIPGGQDVPVGAYAGTIVATVTF
jgi:spore coat protein U-like protein